MNKKLFVILLLIELIFLTALISRNGPVALMSIPFLVFVGTALLTVPRSIQIKAGRELSTLRTGENTPITMTLSIENAGKMIPRIQVIEELNPKMHLIEGSINPQFLIQAKERIRVGYTVTASRGSYEWQTVRLAVSDPFGLFEKLIEINAPGQVHVLPQQVELRQYSYHPLPNIRAAGPNLSRLPGSGIDFWGVREYHPGDSLRSIHWRMAARHPQKFYTKEYEREEISDIGLLLDARVLSNQTTAGLDLFEHSIQAAASLARYFLSLGNRVSMLILNDHLVRVFPGYGKHQLVRILDELSNCDLGERVGFDTLKYLPVKLFPNRSLISVISPLLPNDYSFIARLKAEGYQLLLVTPDGQTENSEKNSKDPYEAYARRMKRLERAVLLRQIQRIHVPIVAWDVSKPQDMAKQFAGILKMRIP